MIPPPRFVADADADDSKIHHICAFLISTKARINTHRSKLSSCIWRKELYCKLRAWWQKLLALIITLSAINFLRLRLRHKSDTRHQQWPTSKHDAATQSTCLVSPMLHAPPLPPKQMRHHFWAQCAPIQHRSRLNQRQQQLHTRCSLRHSIREHPSMMPLRKAAA